MKAEIITIGTEITTGSILNTNSKYLASKLLELGIETYYHTSVDDNVERIKEVIDISLKRADLIVTTGGLGPTQDDITKEIISEALGLKLIDDEDILEIIKEKFNSLNRKMSLNNLKQAKKPEGSIFLNNNIGTAPGIFIKRANKTIVMLPGPPIEMETMFNNEVIPLIKQDYYIINRSINVVDIGESQLEMELRDLINIDPDINIATFPKESEVEIKIIGKSYNREDLEDKVEYFIKIIENRFRDYIYGYDNVPIEEIVFKILKEKNYKIGFAESCTGGLISGRLSRIPGASQVFDRSIITYSNKSKIQELGVNPLTIDKFGVVSEETAIEMAKGLLNREDIDIALSITGLAGPEGGTDEKPIGLVFMCIANRNKAMPIRCNFIGNRENIQNKAVTKAFSELRKFLLNL
ncbi:MAG: competence/damage-inducible protein A [Tissierellia bacterium]|nr:competence/damage-inducible protein A [Tissierellia bacterium]